jgi:hypothetical protein
MSTKYPGGVISKTPPVPAGPYETGAASGIWTLEQQAGYQQQGIWPTAGLVPNYIEDVFSTWLYTGTASPQTITNGIDISTKGGLVWTKSRSLTGSDNFFVDTARGVTKYVQSNSAAAQVTGTDISAFNTNGYSLGSDVNGGFNNNGATFVSWTFREQPKFFDVVTYTGTGVGGQTVAHNLGSAPGMVIIKVTSEANDWWVWHRGLTAGNYIKLNTTAAQSTTNAVFFFGNGTTTVDPTSTVITLGGSGAVSGSGKSYVAYLFAHDAGGFGLTGTDNVISCGSTNGSKVTLGYEPQWILYRSRNFTDDWQIVDNMRGLPVGAVAQVLKPNTSGAETTTSNDITLAADGFTLGAITGTAIYIAIRRGPMKVPTDATKVFAPITFTGSSATRLITGTNFPVDMLMGGQRIASAFSAIVDRLRGAPQGLTTPTTSSETTSNGTTQDVIGFDYMDGYKQGSPYNLNINANTAPNVLWFFRRAPSFFDEVCYTGNGVNGRTITHNLAAVPELMIVKRRTTSDGAGFWAVYSAATGATKFLTLNATSAENTNSTFWNDTAPTSSVFTVGTITRVNGSAETYVAYLFATCAGVSKVFSFTGNGTTQTINCGFAGGARFVLLKASSATGGWYVYDTARGMTTLTDPYLQLNSTAAETATLGSVTTVTTGFAVNEAITTGVNTNGVTYIGLAIA